MAEKGGGAGAEDDDDDDGLCAICMEKDTDVTLMPCRHEIVCGSCAAGIDACPICREVIVDRIWGVKEG